MQLKLRLKSRKKHENISLLEMTLNIHRKKPFMNLLPERMDHTASRHKLNNFIRTFFINGKGYRHG